MTESGTHERAHTSLEHSNRVIRMMQESLDTAQELLQKLHQQAQSFEEHSGVVKDAHAQATLPAEVVTIIRKEEQVFTTRCHDQMTQAIGDKKKRSHHKKGFVAV